MDCYTLDIPLVPPSLNEWQTVHWAERGRIKDKWCDAIWALCNESRVPPMERVHLETVIFFATNRRRDTDNYVVVFKITQDCLKRIGMIPDDNPDHVSFDPPTLEVNKDHPKTILTITPK